MTTSISQFFTVFGIFFILFGPRTLYAVPHEGIGMERGLAFQRDRTPTKVRIEGELSCTAEATGDSSCALNIRENNTGKTYHLTGEDAPAKQLFQSGNKKVAIEGTLSNDSTVNVQSTQAL